MKKLIFLLCFLMLLGCADSEQIESSDTSAIADTMTTPTMVDTLPQTPQYVNSNPKYDIQKEAGEYYLILNEQPEVIGYSAPIFSNLSEMKETILTGGLTDLNLIAFQKYPLGNIGPRIELYNLDRLYEPIVPDHVKVGEITFFGRRYGVSLASQNNEFWSGTATFYKKSDFEKNLLDGLDGIDSRYQTVIENGIEKKVYEYETETSDDGKQYSTSSGKSVYYQFQRNGVVFHVFESFLYSTGFSCVRTSKEYPYQVAVYVEDGNCAKFTFDTLNINPSVDWIADFCSKPIS